LPLHLHREGSKGLAMSPVDPLTSSQVRDY
jgi:hypothetical protein